MDILIPLGEAAIKTVIAQHKQRKQDELLGKLSTAQLKLTDDELKSDKFIASFIKTLSAVEKAENQAKFDFLVDLYVSGLNSKLVFEQPDSLMECMEMLGSMTLRELRFVYLLDTYCKVNNRESEGFDKNMGEMFLKEMNLDHNKFQAMVMRLYRTGFITVEFTVGSAVLPRISSLYRNVLDLVNECWERTRSAQNKEVCVV